jgi:hypothetical protein
MTVWLDLCLIARLTSSRALCVSSSTVYRREKKFKIQGSIAKVTYYDGLGEDLTCQSLPRTAANDCDEAAAFFEWEEVEVAAAAAAIFLLFA